jgi:FkbM family methyltransferase
MVEKAESLKPQQPDSLDTNLTAEQKNRIRHLTQLAKDLKDIASNQETKSNLDLVLAKLIDQWERRDFSTITNSEHSHRYDFVINGVNLSLQLPLSIGEDILCVPHDIFCNNEHMAFGFDQVPSESVIFDLGANIGTYAILMALKNPSARIYAFEPAPGTSAILENNIRLNGLEARVIQLQLAVTGETHDDSIDFTECAGATRISGALALQLFGEFTGFAAAAAQNIRVPATNMLAITTEYGRPDLAKIDIEGTEDEIFTKDYLDSGQLPGKLVVECHTGQITRKIMSLLGPYYTHMQETHENERITQLYFW